MHCGNVKRESGAETPGRFWYIQYCTFEYKFWVSKAAVHKLEFSPHKGCMGFWQLTVPSFICIYSYLFIMMYRKILHEEPNLFSLVSFLTWIFIKKYNVPQCNVTNLSIFNETSEWHSSPFHSSVPQKRATLQISIQPSARFTHRHITARTSTETHTALCQQQPAKRIITQLNIWFNYQSNTVIMAY